MTKSRTPTPVYLDPGMHPGLEVKGLNSYDFRNKVLAISSGIDDPGVIKWDLALCLLLAWIVVYLCICKGIKSSAKVVFTRLSVRLSVCPSICLSAGRPYVCLSAGLDCSLPVYM